MDCPEPWEVRPPRGGRLHRRRRALQIGTTLIWMTASFLGLFRFDLDAKRVVFAGIGFELGELGPLLLLLLLGLLAVFVGALLYGRLWCGWMCPQTALSELADAIDRRLRRRNPQSLPRRAMAAEGVLTVSALIALAVVSYGFTPATLASPPRAAAMTFAALFTVFAADLLWVRHRFCLGLCPYGILLGLVADKHTLGVALDQETLGRCVKCKACTRSCFLGIDIRRRPFESHCLSCGDCIDAINASHQKRGFPLVQGFRFGLEPTGWPSGLAKLGILDLRRALVVLATLFVGLSAAMALAMRAPLDARIAPRFERATALADGSIRNHYNLALGNRLDRSVTLRLEASGLPGLAVVAPPAEVSLIAGEHAHVTLVLRVPGEQLKAGAHGITVRLRANGFGTDTELSTRFFIPERVRS